MKSFSFLILAVMALLQSTAYTSPIETTDATIDNHYLAGDLSTAKIAGMDSFATDKTGFVKLGKDGVFRSYKAGSAAWEVIDWRALDPDQIHQVLTDSGGSVSWDDWAGVDGRGVVSATQIQTPEADLPSFSHPAPMSKPRRTTLEVREDDILLCKDFRCRDGLFCSETYTGDSATTCADGCNFTNAPSTGPNAGLGVCYEQVTCSASFGIVVCS